MRGVKKMRSTEIQLKKKINKERKSKKMCGFSPLYPTDGLNNKRGKGGTPAREGSTHQPKYSRCRQSTYQSKLP